MTNVDPTTLLDCKHCNDTGTCSTGFEGRSCSACVKSHELPNYRFWFWRQDHYGLRCGACNGLLKTDMSTARINNRVAPLLALGIGASLLALSLFLTSMDKSIIPQVITGWFSLAASVIGFYYSGNRPKD